MSRTTLSGAAAMSAIRARRPRLFGAILRKTFRETVYVSVGAWLVVIMWVTEELYSASAGFTAHATHRNTLMDPMALFFTPVGCALLGWVLGMVQFWPLRAFEQWALLMHRPVARSRLFVYAVLAGLLMYGVTVGVPLVIFIGWAVVTPAATPVFYWGLLYPHVAGAIFGVATYFLGSLLAMRQARWYATGSLPLVGGLVFFALSVTLRYFSWAAVLEAVAIAASGLAAWGSALTQGRNRKVPAAARGGLILTMVAGCALPAFFLGAIGYSVADSIARRATEPALEWRTPGYYFSAGPAVLQDGSVAIRVDHFAPTREVKDSTHFESLTGAVLPDAQPMQFTLYANAATQRPSGEPGYDFRSLASVAESRSAAATNPVPAAAGFYIPAGEREVFWSLSSSGREMVQTDRHIYLRDAMTRQAAITLPVTHPNPKFLPAIYVSMDEAFIQVHYYRQDASRTLIERLFGVIGESQVMEVYDRNGSLISSAGFDPHDPILEYYNVPEVYERQQRLASLMFALGVFESAAMTTEYLPLDRVTTLHVFGFQANYLERYFGAGVVTGGAVTAALLGFLARRYRRGWIAAAAWAVLGFFLGPMMVVVFVGTHYRPVRVICPACKQRRPVEEALCPHCGAPAPAPAANGTEIFGGAAAGSSANAAGGMAIRQAIAGGGEL